ncbi:CDP-diacylglycerol--serine O-phosphatidyltransferase [Acidihalobacter ferrooxydans]|uniref:CDP-diacylglycerol--serine O-phosphatidyltransferase n=1 Tax=Acidihalobacter ferrooxydans TaxID=1765967 RepID=A0A1P8UE62_9GAMM|nr:CDP-diacylglycerol--serine O-phosphatidyltransferase [Acidihalobacter ferrooxydans]APZ42079.1 CDP-diacylglycerol--serine O-phosphatidyltransferase [Acidihalobacter ferrooxydans]
MSNQSEQVQPAKHRRGIYLLPNLFTTAALFGGFYAIVAAMSGRFTDAAIAVFIAMVLDGLDGRVARMTNTQSAFGAEYDSLSDMVSFGLAPALVMYQWSLVDLHTLGWFGGKASWLVAFFYAASAALRLARFNTKIGVADKRYFQGLPSPTAAAVMMGTVWVAPQFQLSGTTLMFPALVITVLTGALMVSNVAYYSFKDFDLRKRVPFFAVLLVLGIFVLIALWPSIVLYSLFVTYTLSGPALSVWRRWRKRRRNRAGAESRSEES